MDPQQAPLPGDQSMGLDEFGTTVEEQIEGEPLDLRVGRKIPEDQAMFGGDDEPVVQPAPKGRPDRTGTWTR